MAKTQPYHILMVDDDPDLLESNRVFFEQRGYKTVCASDARSAIAAAAAAKFDCIVLDIDLPGTDGFDLCRVIRESSALPIVFLSSYDEDEIRVRGLTVGGDDYVSKACSQEELELRVRLRILRRYTNPPEILRFGELAIDTAARTVTYGGVDLNLYRIEFDVLVFLARNPGRVYSYEQLYDGVWHEPINLGRHSVQARIADLRKKLCTASPDKAYIETIRHKGYRFVP